MASLHVGVDVGGVSISASIGGGAPAPAAPAPAPASSEPAPGAGAGARSSTSERPPMFDRQKSVATIARLDRELKEGRERQAALEAELKRVAAQPPAATAPASSSSSAAAHSGESKEAITTLSAAQVKRLEDIFKLIDSDSSGSIDKHEAVEFARTFADDVEAAQKADRLFADVDQDKSNTLQLDEWIKFFRKIIPPGMNDADFDLYFGRLEATIRLSKQPVKWTERMRYLFMTMLIVQITLCAILLGFSLDQSSDWEGITTIVGSSFATTSLRVAYAILGLAFGLLGLLAAARRSAGLLQFFAFLSVSLTIINIVSGSLDASLISSAAVQCLQACTAQGLPAAQCDACTTQGKYKITLALAAAIILSGAFPAIIAVFYSTKCGSNRYLNEWGRTYSKLSGIAGFNRLEFFASPRHAPATSA